MTEIRREIHTPKRLYMSAILNEDKFILEFPELDYNNKPLRCVMDKKVLPQLLPIIEEFLSKDGQVCEADRKKDERIKELERALEDIDGYTTIETNPRVTSILNKVLGFRIKRLHIDSEWFFKKYDMNKEKK